MSTEKVRESIYNIFLSDMISKMLKLTETYRNHGMLVLQMGMEPWLFIFQADYMQVCHLLI